MEDKNKEHEERELIEFPTITNILLSFGGVVLGFILSEGGNKWRIRRQRIKIGETFDLELASLKDALKNQIIHNKFYSEKIKVFSHTPPTFYIFKNLDFVKSLDRHVVNEYYRLEKKNTDQKKIRVIYNSFNVIEAELERFMSFYEDYNSKISTLYHKYNEYGNTFVRSMGDFYIKNKETIKDDTFFNELSGLVKSTLFGNNGAIDDIMPFEDSLHTKLISLETQHTHPLREEMTVFNRKGRDIISTIKSDSDNYKKRVDNLTLSLENCYKKVFGEEIKEENTTVNL
jgi:hypothetical protein